ncbi:MAG: hypothetical protein PHN49_07400 [Candidatus Omnitrophica bacterium]|nr:hypothetical protein [Candidatus Omnitrophota bacterium]MDD5671447.1 hypothetical protein [Candidatus Omnitrophota bacterium]
MRKRRFAPTLFFALMGALSAIVWAQTAVAPANPRTVLESRFEEALGQPVATTIAGTQSVNDTGFNLKVFASDRPVVVFYYQDDADSRGLAFLYKYLMLKYAGRIKFLAFQVNESNPSGPDRASQVIDKYSLKELPSLAFYKIREGKMTRVDTMDGGFHSFEFFLKNMQIFDLFIPKSILD